MPRKSARDDLPISVAVEQLDDDMARQLLVAAAEQHESVAQAVRLAAASDDDRLAVLRAAVDDGLRTRRHLDYWESSAWAADAAPVVDALTSEVAARPSAELVVLLQRAAEHLVKVILHADDSDGTIGALASDVLEQHRLACAAGVAEPRALAKWMVRFTFEDQDFFTIDPVAYVDALGGAGLAVYRQEVANRSDPANAPTLRSADLRRMYGEFPSFAARYAAERLAVIDRDVDRLVELLGGDLSAPHQFTRVAEAMVELGRRDDALAWARRGIAETTGWQVARLYDLAADLLTESDDLGEVVALRREQHQRMPSASTYSKLQTVARAADSWAAEIGPARAMLAERDPAGLVDALLADGDGDGAWRTATSENGHLSTSQWQRLAEAREATEPAEAMVVYQRLAEEALDHADRRAYQAAVRYLKAARRAATAADRSPEFTLHVAALRERNRRRPTLIAMLDKAGMR
jgi:hypothetical protein